MLTDLKHIAKFCNIVLINLRLPMPTSFPTQDHTYHFAWVVQGESRNINLMYPWRQGNNILLIKPATHATLYIDIPLPLLIVGMNLLIYDWLWENLSVMHEDWYLIQLFKVYSWECLKLQACNFPWIHSYFLAIRLPTPQCTASWISCHFR